MNLARPTPVSSEVEDTNGQPQPQTLPILPLRGLVVYPLTAVPLNVGQPRSIKLIDDATQGSNLIGLFASHDPEVNTPGPGEIYRVGTVAAVHRLLRKSDGTIRLLVNGLHRARIKVFTSVDPYLVAEVEPLPEVIATGTKVEAMARNLVDMFLRLAEFVPSIPGDLLASSLNLEDPLQLTYIIATYIRLDLSQAQELLELDQLTEKLEWLIRHIGREIEVLEMGQRIRSEAFGQMEQAQREYFLREQLKAIQRELGEADERTVEIQDFQKRIEAAGMPEEAQREAKRELNRLMRLPVAAAEYGVVRTYLEWLTTLPWSKLTADNLDLGHARQVLDEDHHGLEEIKDRIIEYLAVRRLRQARQVDEADRQDTITSPRQERTGAILCFVGPPGVGKTSLGRSIARAMGRKFARISLGGMRDEAEIRGHRRTYIGALPGRIIQTLRRLESKNPVIILDEVDKLGADFRGDPASALLEVLDPEQNREFRDHYLDLPFDLSAVMFITTANYLDPIPGPLRDRMEVLQLAGYTESEKVAIARQYLVPRQIRENGLRPSEIYFETETLRTVIQDYTREAGVRNLDRQIGRVCRKVATIVASAEASRADGADNQVQITPEVLSEYLGPTRYFAEVSRRTRTPGVATGLSWTAVGGSILFVEAAKMPGSKGLTITGHLGDVMRESAQAALSYIRSRADQLNIEPDFFAKHDIHIHVPAGAIPKDGPSAGITIAAALASLLTGRPVRDDVGMTGEITLRGQLMPVGGLKEKVLAAHRAGLRTVIMPEQNDQDLADIPEEISRELHFVLAGNIDEALATALEE
ncbi:MAG TPA: endopeptidase La [Anaerolineae bacterium]